MADPGTQNMPPALDAANAPMPDVQQGTAPAAPPINPAAGNLRLMSIRIDVPDIRNGDAANITQAAPKASVSLEYKWAHIQGMPAAMAVTYVDAMIRAQYAQLVSADHRASAMTDSVRAEARTAAIILGSARAGAAAAFRLEAKDMNSDEVVAAGSVIDNAAEPTRAIISTGGGTAGGKHTIAESMAPLTGAEAAIVGALTYLGMAVPVMQGISLVLTGHHFLPSTRNTFMGMKRQTSQIGGAEVAQWIEQQGDKFDDLMFHKSCHPILPALKRRWAKTTSFAEKLRASGHSAAAIRLPALPSDAQGGKAAIAVVEKARPVIAAMGHTITLTDGPATVKAVEDAAEGREEVAAVNGVKAWLAANSAAIAFCAGIVQAIAESAGTGRETTLAAYSMRKVMSEQQAEVSRGSTYARAHMTRLRDQALSGEFPDPRIIL